MKKQQSKKKIPINTKEIMQTRLQVKTRKVPKKKIDLSILLNLKIKNLEKKQSRNYQILRIQKFYILMIGFLTVALLKQPKILWTKLN